jgi:glycosyltransferase involved in cell wall biosynthesis
LELRFEDLVTPDEGLLKKIAAFIGFEGTLKPFQNPMGTVHAKNPDFFRKGKKTWEKSDKWSEFQEAAFLVMHGELMLQLNYCTSDALDEASRIVGQQVSSLLKHAKRGFEDRNDLRFEIEKKEKAIELLTNDLVRTKKRLKSLEVINWPLARLHRAITIFRPRLGWLSQYEPRQLTVQNGSEGIEVLDKPKVSVVTPSFNQAEYIGRTIDSVLGQGYSNLEYFVQDGGSDDGTDEVLRQYESQISGWKSEPDSGQSQAINRGFSQTSGEIMAWLNSDDLLMPGAMHAVVDYFDKHPEVDVVYGDRLMIDENDHEIGRWILPGHDSNALEWADYIPQETMFWRRGIWEKAGAHIDESFRFAMDWDLLIRFHKAGAKFGHIPRFLGAFRIHEQQKTSSVINEVGIQEMNRIRERVHGYTPDRIVVRRKVTSFLIKHIIKDLGYRIKTRLSHKFKLS